MFSKYNDAFAKYTCTFLRDSYAHIFKQNIFHNIEVKYSKEHEYSHVEFTKGGKEPPFRMFKKKK